MLKNFLLLLINIYSRAISPFIKARCRYYPTCSHYGRQAILWHGAVKGVFLLSKRLLKCHPFGGSGVDFVPVPLYRYHYILTNLKIQFIYKDTTSYKCLLNHLMKMS